MDVTLFGDVEQLAWLCDGSFGDLMAHLDLVAHLDDKLAHLQDDNSLVGDVVLIGRTSDSWDSHPGFESAICIHDPIIPMTLPCHCVILHWKISTGAKTIKLCACKMWRA